MTQLTRLETDFLAELRILQVDPCCPDCWSNGEFIHLRTKTLMVSTQSTCRNEQQVGAVDELLEIQSKLKGEWLVDGAMGFVRYLNGLGSAYNAQQRVGPAKVLDLIDHSLFGHTLNIGGRPNGVSMTKVWLNKNPSVLDALRGVVVAGIVCGVRLLGCRTGCEDGYQNLVDLHDLLRVPVWGTTRLTDREDYSEGGVIDAPGLFVSNASWAARC